MDTKEDKARVEEEISIAAATLKAYLEEYKNLTAELDLLRACRIIYIIMQ